MKNRSLIIISVPFARNPRFFLSSKIFERLKEEYDLLIVSPFSDLDNFQEEFGGPNVFFEVFNKTDSQLNILLRKLYTLSETIRFNGYWFRFRNKKMRYYWWQSSSITIDDSSEKITIKKKAFRKQLITYFSGLIGYFRFSWRLFDRVFGAFFYDTENILRYTEKYKNVIICQTANWGYQERFLTYFAHKFSYKCILVPYTTDQLITNGYLINNFNKICTQGPIETEYAIKYHGVHSQQICKLGMLWIRNIESLFPKHIREQQSNKGKERIILYAGVSPTYFPRISEFEAIDEILSAIKSGVLSNSKLIYRPVLKDDSELNVIKNRFQNEYFIEIQIPEPTLIGMSEYTITSTVKEQIIDYLKTISAISVLVMSGTTTLMFDALYFCLPTILNLADPTGTLKSRRVTDLFIEDDAVGIFSSGVSVIFSFHDLIQKIKEELDNPSSCAQVRENILSSWDYQNQNYVGDFMNLIKELSS